MISSKIASLEARLARLENKLAAKQVDYKLWQLYEKLVRKLETEGYYTDRDSFTFESIASPDGSLYVQYKGNNVVAYDNEDAPYGEYGDALLYVNIKNSMRSPGFVDISIAPSLRDLSHTRMVSSLPSTDIVKISQFIQNKMNTYIHSLS